MRCVLAVVFLFASSAASSAQSVPIYLDVTADDDSVGSRFAFELKEAILGSLSFRLVEAKSWPHLRLTIVTMAETKDVKTVVAVAYSVDDIDQEAQGALLHVTVQSCGADKVATCARSTLAAANGAVERLTRSSPELRKRLK